MYYLMQVGGGYFVARWDVMLTWIHEYMATVEAMMTIRVMSTDQQVIYTAFNNVTNPPTTTFQTFKSYGRYDAWFHLAYISRDAGAECKRFLDSVPGYNVSRVEMWNETLNSYLKNNGTYTVSRLKNRNSFE